MLADPALATRWMESLAQNKPKAALVAWMSVAFAALAMIISTRAAPSKPLPHALFVLAAIVLIIYEDKVFDTIRNAVTFLWVCGIVISFANWSRYNTLAKAYAEHCCRESDVVQQTVLLSSFLTPAVHEKVKRNERVADSFSNLTVIFADMVGFTALSRRISPGHLVDVLNEIFAAGDEIAAACGIEKVKTIGDCYMAVTGGIASPERGAADAIGFAQRYLKKVEEVSQRLDIPLALRVGIHTGPAVGGIIGTSRPAYDYWGDTVNLASRLESASGAGRILVSESTWLQTKRDFEFEAGNDIEVKGVGSVRSHFIAKALLEDNIVPLVKRSN